MKLLSFERKMLSEFVLMTKDDRERTLKEARFNPRTSGDLIAAMREINQFL